MVITDQGKILRVPVSGFSVIGRNTQGVTLMNTEENEKVVAVARLAEKDEEDMDEDESVEEGVDEI
jgi:DNA gyrase subunit A